MFNVISSKENFRYLSVVRFVLFVATRSAPPLKKECPIREIQDEVENLIPFLKVNIALLTL